VTFDPRPYKRYCPQEDTCNQNPRVRPAKW
jgi:hypothetical protein